VFLFLAGLLAASTQAAPADLYARVVRSARERVESEFLATASFEVDHSRWEDPWVVRSLRFEVRTTLTYAQGAKIAKSLEFLLGEFERIVGALPPRDAPFRIWIFPNLGAYNQFGTDFGAEHSSLLGSFFSTQSPDQPVATYQTSNPTLLGMWITHSAVHQWLETSFAAQPPVWVSEGLASYFALYWDWAYGARELDRIEASPSWVPLERLMRDPLAAYLERPEDRFVELGMLFHFLLDACEATRNAPDGTPGTFQEFLRLAVRGQDTSQTDFVLSLEGALDLLEDEFKNHDFAGD
jgi:hypothetical protein